MASVEKIPLDEAREWFWVRTAVWFLPTFIVTTMAFFEYIGDTAGPFKLRVLISLACGFGSSFLGLLSGAISMEFPWMRLGRRRLWWFNAIVCSLLAGASTIALGIVIMTMCRDNQAFTPDTNAFRATKALVKVSSIAAAFWGTAFGTWFALRFDRYFVESL